MAVNPAQDLANLQQLRSDAIAVLAAEEAYQRVHGAKASYTLNGKNVQWTEFRTGKLEEIEKLNVLIQIDGGPFEIRTQGLT